LDLTRQYATIATELNEAALAVLASGGYIGGARVIEFEAQFAQYIGTAEAVSCNSGTDALYLSLRALGIGAGDEVITVPFTFIATAEVVSAVGAKPVFVDVDPLTLNMDLMAIEAAITPQTKAIVPVHLFGQPVDMTRLMEIAKSRNLYVIEDCAQATGAAWQGKKVGSFGDVGCFSFFPTKNLGGCGDGGAIVVNDTSLAADLRMYREHGSRQRYYHEVVGINSRLDAIQAALLSVKLRYLDCWNIGRAKVASRYLELLHGIEGIILPQITSGGTHVWNQFTIRLIDPTGKIGGEYRDRVREDLLAAGVISMIYYPLPLHLQSVYKNLGYHVGDFPVTESVSHQVLSLPIFPELTEAEQERVFATLKEVL
jgi:dTDP-4-amino-4,6-dideoxygalactose transaminase